MGIDMDQNYCMINTETNVCDNVCIWDGNPETWAPPPNYLMLVQKDTPAKTWQLTGDQYELVVTMGVGSIYFTWDGTYLITNEPQPEPPSQLVTSGVTDL